MASQKILIMTALLGIGSLASAEFPHGRWDLLKTYCNFDETTSRGKETTLFRRGWFGSKPQVELTFFEFNGEKYLQKSVKELSCGSPAQNSDEVLNSTFKVSSFYPISGTTQEIPAWERSTRYEIGKGQEVVDWRVNYEALFNCPNISKLDKFRASVISLWLFPKYFYHEAARGYTVRFQDDKLYLSFVDSEICNASEKTTMILKRVER